MTELERMQRELDALKAAQRPRTHDEDNAVVAAFERAAAVFELHGERAPRDLAGEKPEAYRRRLLKNAQELLPDSSTYKRITPDATCIDPGLSLVEAAVFAEIVNEAKHPTRNDAARPALVGVSTRDAQGRTRTEYFGSSRAGLGAFVSTATFIGKIVKPRAGE